jgi:hypothetical protein
VVKDIVKHQIVQVGRVSGVLEDLAVDGETVISLRACRVEPGEEGLPGMNLTYLQRNRWKCYKMKPTILSMRSKISEKK